MVGHYSYSGWRAPLVVTILLAFLSMPSVAAESKLRPCVPNQSPPPRGCLRQEPAPGAPAPPLNPPGVSPPQTPDSNSPAVVKPPPTGDNEIVKPTPPSLDKMPMVKPPASTDPK